MTIVDQYSSTCNDCTHTWTSFVGVSTNTFGMTPDEAKSHIESFTSLELRSPFYCRQCGSFDVSYSTPSGYGSKDGRTGPRDILDALVPVIREAAYQLEQKPDVQEDVRDRELSRLGAYEEIASEYAEKLASTTTEGDRKAVLKELAELVREWEDNPSPADQLFDIPSWLGRWWP